MPAVPYIFMAVSAAGAVSTAQNQKAAARAEEDAQEFNTQIALNEAEATKKAYAKKEELQREKADYLKSRQRALYAKAGVDLTSGSPLLVMMNDAEAAEEDALMIRAEGETVANKYKNQAGLFNFYGSQAIASGERAARTTLLQGVGNMGSSYMRSRSGTGYDPSDPYAGKHGKLIGY